MRDFIQTVFILSEIIYMVLYVKKIGIFCLIFKTCFHVKRVYIKCAPLYKVKKVLASFYLDNKRRKTRTLGFKAP